MLFLTRWENGKYIQQNTSALALWINRHYRNICFWVVNVAYGRDGNMGLTIIICIILFRWGRYNASINTSHLIRQCIVFFVITYWLFIFVSLIMTTYYKRIAHKAEWNNTIYTHIWGMKENPVPSKWETSLHEYNGPISNRSESQQRTICVHIYWNAIWYHWGLAYPWSTRNIWYIKFHIKYTHRNK